MPSPRCLVLLKGNEVFRVKARLGRRVVADHDLFDGLGDAWLPDPEFAGAVEIRIGIGGFEGCEFLGRLDIRRRCGGLLFTCFVEQLAAAWEGGAEIAGI